MGKSQKTSPVVPFFLAAVFGAATMTGVGTALLFYVSQLQGWFFTRVW